MNTREKFRGTTADEITRLLDAVRSCSARGPVLPHTVQPECGCAELTACRAGRGRAGAVTLEECVRCRFEILAPPPHEQAAESNESIVSLMIHD